MITPYMPRIVRTLLICAAVFFGCADPGPVRIGFMAGLSGKVADLGISGRNGVILAVEQQNQAGGINGRPVELVVRDDRQDPEAAVLAVRELLDLDLDVIIGPMTSSMAMAVVPTVNETDTLLVSPTVTTTKLEGIDDQFIRMISTTRDYAEKNARYQRETLGHRTGAAIYDIGNRAYSETWFHNFKTVFQDLGGTITATHEFKSGKNNVFFDTIKRLLQNPPDFLLVIANAVDAALICQQVRKLNPDIAIVLSEWASTERLIQLGGTATEGIFIAQFLDRNDTSPRYTGFREQYRKRFGQEPGFAGLAGYDTALVVLDAYTGKKGDTFLKQALTQKTFQCIQEDITINRFGDANRSTHMSTIKNGRYVTLD